MVKKPNQTKKKNNLKCPFSGVWHDDRLSYVKKMSAFLPLFAWGWL
jgi:hypothetical protein